MNAWSVAGAAILSAMLIVLLKTWDPGFAGAARLAASLLLFGAVAAIALPLCSEIRELFSLSGTEAYAAPLLRAAGVALICEMTAAFCRDLGENAVAEGILLFGKVEIAVLSLPLLRQLLSVARTLLSW
jgi:stage III sporulation protein AD